MRIAICDDNVEVLDFLEKEIIGYFGDRFVVTGYQDSEELLEAWKSPKKRADIVIMDIVFEYTNGVQTARRIQEKYGECIKFIFMTGYPEKAPEIFRANPVFLLAKPISKEFLYEAITKAEALIREENQNALYVSFRGCTRRIKASDIYYIESIRKKAILYHADGAEETMQKLNDIEKQLPQYFLRIHQSFLVNMNFIKAISAYQLELADGVTLPISRSKSKFAKEKFLDFLSNNL